MDKFGNNNRTKADILALILAIAFKRMSLSIESEEFFA
jgi:hypothetical protein